MSLPGAEKHKKLAEPPSPVGALVHLWLQLLAPKGPGGPQNKIGVPALSEAQDHVHPSACTTVCKTTRKYLHIGSAWLSVALGSIPAVQEGSGGFVLPNTRVSPAASGPAGPAFTQVSLRPPSSGVRLPARSAGRPQSHLHPGSSGELSGWSFSTRSTAGSDSGRRPAEQGEGGWECQPLVSTPKGGNLSPGGTCFDPNQGRARASRSRDSIHTSLIWTVNTHPLTLLGKLPTGIRDCAK